MKKVKLISLGLILTLGLSVAGCGKKSGEFKNPQAMIDKYSAYGQLGEYKGLEFNAANKVITDEAIDNSIDQNFSSFSTTEYVEEGTAKIGDTVNIDYVGSIDGVEFAGGNTQGGGAILVLGSHSYIDDFEDQVAGHKVGDEFDVIVTFPENYGNSDLAGKEAVFKTKLNSIAKITKPEYTDEFISSNTSYSTYNEYRESIEKNLKDKIASSNEEYNKSSIFSIVYDKSTVTEIPQQEAEKMIETIVSNVTKQASDYGYDLPTYVTAIYGMSSEDAFKEYVASEVNSILTEKIIVCSIAKAEGITVSNDDVQNYKKELISKYGYSSASEFEKNYPYTKDDYMYGAIAKAVMDFLLENNTPVYAE